MWWSNLFAGMSPANFFNFSFLPKYLSFFVQGLEYTLLLSIISVGLAVIPALANELVTMVKESSICSVLGMTELIWGAKTVATTTYKTLSPYVLAALVYFVINYPASKAIEAIERRMRRGDRI